MNQNEGSQQPYYDEEEVIGSYLKYHRPSCFVIKNIQWRNHKRLRSWQSAVALGLEPCNICRPFCPQALKQSPAPEVNPPIAAAMVTVSQLSEWRRRLVQLLARLDVSKDSSDRVGGRISQLARDGLIPREIAAVMRTITEMRNAAEYESKILSAAESAVVLAAWVAVEEWALAKRLTI